MSKEKDIAIIYSDDIVSQYIDNSSDNSRYLLFSKLQHILNEDEINFLHEFIEDNTLLTQSQVAKKMGCTSQWISLKWTKITKKIQKNTKHLFF